MNYFPFFCIPSAMVFLDPSIQDEPLDLSIKRPPSETEDNFGVHCDKRRDKRISSDGIESQYPVRIEKSTASAERDGTSCAVCALPATGFHYGAITCEGFVNYCTGPSFLCLTIIVCSNFF